MNNASVAKRYAKALFLLAKEHGQVNEIREELFVLQTVFKIDDVNRFFKAPNIASFDKKNVVKNVFTSFSCLLQNLVCIFIDKHRTEIVSELVNEYVELVNLEQDCADALVISAKKLTQKELTYISQAISKKLNKKKLNSINQIDESVLGGIKVRVGNIVIDGTLRNKLDSLERRLLAL